MDVSNGGSYFYPLTEFERSNQPCRVMHNFTSFLESTDILFRMMCPREKYIGHHCICVLADSYLLILFSFNLENLSNYLLLLNLLNFILDLYSNF